MPGGTLRRMAWAAACAGVTGRGYGWFFVKSSMAQKKRGGGMVRRPFGLRFG